MQPDHSVATLADNDEQVTYDIPGLVTDRHQALRQALADTLALARLQAEVLVRLEVADEVGDDESVLPCHAELDHVMATMAETEQVRVGNRSALPLRRITRQILHALLRRLHAAGERRVIA